MTFGRVCAMPRCQTPIKRSNTIGVCGPCGWTIAQAYKDRILAAHRQEMNHWREDVLPPPLDQRPGVVYYVRISDYVKIGYTTNIEERLRSLRVEWADVIAIEPGPPELERERHRQFAGDRIHTRRENFRPSERLLAHALALLAEHRLPAAANAPRTSQVRHAHVEVDSEE